MTPRATGTVSFLFTDIESSTRHWEEHPAWMAHAFARQEAIIREAAACHGGYVYKMVGDAFQIAFSDAASAIAAAAEAQRALQAEPWGECGPLRVRMVLHTGVAEERGDDYVGPTLNRAGRLLDVAYGGQVLVSPSTAALVSDPSSSDHVLRDLGLHRLKDLVRPEHIYQLTAPGLASDFPALRTLSSHSHNLPIQMTSFIGREQPLTEIGHLLAAQRLVTLTGAGGTGKTRLALQVGANLLDQFEDGVWLVELAPVAEPGRVAESVAYALGLPDDPTRTFNMILRDYMRRREIALILDNCEHLVQACAELASDLLGTCSQLKILATSRQALGIPGEATFYVPSFAVPNPARLPPLDELARIEAIRLFVDRAVAAKPDFAFTAANASAVAQICHTLDGMPLAIELAAARLRIMRVEELATRLDDRFSLLTSGSRTVLPRHQTLRALVSWSYDLLDEQERALLKRLSIFAGGCTLAAAEVVCSGAPLDRGEILDLLARLVEKSLVIADQRAEHTRYRMLETIRQYARQKLEDAGETTAIASRHLDYMIVFSRDVVPRFHGPEPRRWLDRLENEYDNISAALDWGLASGAVERELELATALGEFWDWRALSAGCKWILAGLSLARETPISQPIMVQALTTAGMLLDLQANLEQASAFLREAMTLAQSLGDRSLETDALRWLAVVATAAGNHGEADQMYQAALERLQQAGDRSVIGDVLTNFGINKTLEGQLQESARLCEQGLQIGLELKDSRLIGISSAMLGLVLFFLGQYGRVPGVIRQGLLACALLDEYLMSGFCLYAAGALAGIKGDPQRGARLHAAGQSAHEAIGYRIPPGAQSVWQMLLRVVKEPLDEETFRARWEEGRAMSLQQAVEYALEEIDGSSS